MLVGERLQAQQLLARFVGLRQPAHERIDAGLGPSLIVCPATVLRQWVTEFRAWWPPLRVAVLHSSGSHAGTPRNLIRAMNSTPGGVLVMSYAAVAAHAEQLAGLDWHYVVLDEGHKIRNPEAQVGEIILKDRYSM